MGRILYIARAGLGAMGEVALSHYVRHVRAHHQVFVTSPPARDDIVLPPPEGVVSRVLPNAPPQKRQLALFDMIREIRPDIIHMIQSPYCFEDMMGLKLVFPEVKWVLDFRSPHIGARDARILDRFQAMHLHVDKLLTHARLSLKTNIRRNWRRAVEVPPGVDAAAIRMADAPQVPPRTFVYIGSISKTRKMEDFVDLFGGLLKAADSAIAQVRLDIIGGGNGVEDLRRHIAERGWFSAIRVIDPMPQQMLWDKIAAYDAGLAYVPMGDFESAPSLKSIEFAAAGLPVLASGTPGHVDFERRYGFRFHLFENTAEDFAATVAALPARIRPGDQAHNRRAAEALDWAHIVKRHLLPVYAELMR